MRTLVPYLEQRVDGRAVGIARIVVGLAALLKGLIAAADLRLLQTGDHLMFPYPWQPVSILGIGIETVVAACWLVFALFFMVGFGARTSGGLLALSMFLVIGADQQLYTNHLYLLASLVALLTIAGPGSYYSIDQWLKPHDRTVPWWSLMLIKLQLMSVYLFAAVTKLNHDFLGGGVLEIALEPLMKQHVTELVTLEMMAYAAVATELFLAFAFWGWRVRWMALMVATGFHTANVVLMDHGLIIDFSVFGAIMAAMVLMHFSDVIAGHGGRW